MRQDTELLGLDSQKLWDVTKAFVHLKAHGFDVSRRTAERTLHSLGFMFQPLTASDLEDEDGSGAKLMIVESLVKAARKKKKLVLFARWLILPNGVEVLAANDARGARYWYPLNPIAGSREPSHVLKILNAIENELERRVSFFLSGELVGILRENLNFDGPEINISVHSSKLELSTARAHDFSLPSYLRDLESESIHIMREAVAEARKPVMLFSAGKDSCVMLHLAKLAFQPSTPPFPLLHIDTRWKFKEMYLFRDYVASSNNMELIVHINPEAIERDINPFEHGSAMHTTITKTEGLRQALEQHGFDVIFGGARRDEEKSRAKERIFSFRDAAHQWNPRRQRPELWSLYNAKVSLGDSVRVFPLSNWTEMDIWKYIFQKRIEVPSLYLSRKRAVVERNEQFLAVDDERFRLNEGEEVVEKNVRFRTLGCYPLTAGSLSSACQLDEMLEELQATNLSERQGRLIDSDPGESMEKKKKEGYF